MIFLMQFMLLFFGLFLAGLGGIAPMPIPYILKLLFFIVGCIIAFFGVFLVYTRATKTGVDNLIEPSKPGVINWLFVHRDGSIEIVPSIREIESTLFSPKLDSMIHDFKRYTIFDHSVRLVAEGHGHSADVGLCLYADYLKRKGFPNITKAREVGREYIKPVDIKKVESGLYERL